MAKSAGPASFRRSGLGNQVFVNGKDLGSHRGGYDPFTFDITGVLREEEQQEVIVSVWDPTDAGWQLRGKQTLHPGGSTYTACSGIWQTVWLEPVPLSSIESLHLIPDLANGSLKLTVDARTPVGTTQVRVTVKEGGHSISSATGTLGSELTEGVRVNLAWYKARLIWVTTDITVPMKDAKPWTPDVPVLHDVVVQLLGDDGNVLDSVTSYVGMRSIAVGKDEHGVPRPMLNGKPIMLPGALDQGYWPDGVYTHRPMRPCVSTSRRPNGWALQQFANTSRSSRSDSTTGPTDSACLSSRIFPVARTATRTPTFPRRPKPQPPAKWNGGS